MSKVISELRVTLPDVEDRLRLFDWSIYRQRESQASQASEAASHDRGWTREDLYIRGGSRCLPVLLFLVLCGLASMAGAADLADSVARIDALFAPWASKEKPGCTIGIDQDGEARVRLGYGIADLEHDVANSPDTIIEAGSVSKQFTAAAVLLLEQQGKLALTDEVRKYVPELPDYGKPLTIDHLVHHTSGLRDWGAVAEIAGWPRGSRVHTHAHVLDIVSRQKALNHDPGAAFSYTNSGYNLLAVIVQRVSGQSLAEFTRQQIFVPLSMTHTQWRDDFTRIVKNRAIAYVPEGDGYHSNMPFENVYGNGGLLTTVGDLLIWNRIFTDPKVGGPALVKALERRYRLNDGTEIEYASGLFFTSYKGVPEVSHSGATAGYRAFLARYPEQSEQRLSVAVLCNAGDANAVELAHKAAEIFLAGQTKDVPSEPKNPMEAKPVPELTAAQLSEYAGEYISDEAEVTYTVEVDGGKLVLRSRPDVSSDLKPMGVDEFESDAGVTLRFKRSFKGNTAGKISEVSFGLPRVWDLRFRRSR